MRLKVPSFLIFRSLAPAQVEVAMRRFWIHSVWIAYLLYVVLAWVRTLNSSSRRIAGTCAGPLPVPGV
jgi:hypothetical protein